MLGEWGVSRSATAGAAVGLLDRQDLDRPVQQSCPREGRLRMGQRASPQVSSSNAGCSPPFRPGRAGSWPNGLEQRSFWLADG